jgi:hypothetical protein
LRGAGCRAKPPRSASAAARHGQRALRCMGRPRDVAGWARCAGPQAGPELKAPRSL